MERLAYDAAKRRPALEGVHFVWGANGCVVEASNGEVYVRLSVGAVYYDDTNVVVSKSDAKGLMFRGRLPPNADVQCTADSLRINGCEAYLIPHKYPGVDGVLKGTYGEDYGHAIVVPPKSLSKLHSAAGKLPVKSIELSQKQRSTCAVRFNLGPEFEGWECVGAISTLE